MQGDIRFENVSFSYPARPDHLVLNKLNLKILKNKKTSLVGESGITNPPYIDNYYYDQGCGKSTILQLIERFYDVESGALFIDNLDIKEFNLKSLR